MKKIYAIGALTVALVLGGGWLLNRPATQLDLALPGAAQAQDTTTEAPAEEVVIDTSTIQDMVQGSLDAPIEIIEYGSFTCPHCAAFHAEQYQQIKANYIDTGKARFIFREVYFDRFGLWASMVARCGGELRFFGIADILYDTQQDWVAGGDPALIAESLRKIGLTAGLDSAMLDTCLGDATMAQTLVAWYEENNARDGIEGTPTFFINGTKYSNMAYADFAAILDAELAKVE
jgi:protein-disulfide isomerase